MSGERFVSVEAVRRAVKDWLTKKLDDDYKVMIRATRYGSVRYLRAYIEDKELGGVSVLNMKRIVRMPGLIWIDPAKRSLKLLINIRDFLNGIEEEES